MKKTLCFLIVILVLSCANKTYSQTKSDLKYSESIKKADDALKLIEIKYSESREKTIGSLESIWKCKLPLFTKGGITLNGKISFNITIMVSELKPVDEEKKEINIKLTTDLIKKSVLNYRKFSNLIIITSYTTSDGERRTSSETIKMADL